jgi:IS5 family transposase
MEQQTSFTQMEYAAKKKPTRRERFLGDMEKLIPWQALIETIAPFYPKGERGRPPMGMEKMLRVYFLQQWYALADEALEDALYDSLALRAFVGLTGREPVPDATTLLHFRHLLEKHDLTRALFAAINTRLASHGLLVREGTIVDATIIAAPCSTKNKAKARDPEMHQARKGNEWHFGMKAHIGVDVHSGVVHSLSGTAANVADITETHRLLHGKEKNALADAGYQGVEKRAEIEAKFPQVCWLVARKRSKIRKMAEGRLKELTQAVEKQKAQLRAFVEHPFHVIKNLFRHRKARYRGLAKNTAQLHSLFALANLVIARPCLLAAKP